MERTDTTTPRSPRRRLLLGATALALALGGTAALAQTALFQRSGPVEGPVTVDLYDVDPNSEGAAPIATLELEPPIDPAELTATEGATYAVVRGSFERVVDLERLDERMGERMGAGPRFDGGRFDGRAAPRGARMGRGGFGPAGVRGAPGTPLRGLADGSRVTVTLYDGDPAAGGSVTDTLDFTVGEDDPLAFRDAVQGARASGAWIEIDVDGQARALPGSSVQDDAE